MRQPAFLLLLLLLSSRLFAQVQGIVYDAATKLPLPEVLVSAGPLTAVTDASGSFTFPALSQAGTTVQLSFSSHPRYRDTTLVVQSPASLRLYLQPSAIHLKEVEVVAAEDAGTETTKLSRKELERLSKPLGEADLVRALQYRAGVLQTGETQSGLFVRGGKNSQTAILLQGIPIFNAAHLLGINNALDPDAYASVRLSSGGFSASEGGWLSAYLQAEPRTTEALPRRLKLGVGILSSELSYQQQMPRYKTTVFAKAKSSYYQLLAKAYEQLHAADEQHHNPLPDYAFSDLNLQLFKHLPKGSLSLAVFGSQDGYTGTTDRISLNSRWGNRLLSVRWKHRLGPAWLEVTQGYSRYAFSLEHQRQETNLLHQTTAGYFSHLQLGLPLGKVGFIETGAFFQQLEATVDASLRDREDRLLHSDAFLEELPVAGLFAQAQVAFHKFTYTAGTRLYKQGQHFLPAPRLKLALNDQNWSSSLYFDRTYQFHHQVNVLGINMPFDFFRLASDKLPFQQADQLGISVNRPVAQHHFSAGLYHRRLRGQLYHANASTLLTNFDQDLNAHTGRAYGLELEMQAHWSPLSLTANYTLAYSKVALEAETGARVWVYPAQDVRHQVNTTFSYALNQRWRFTGQWFLQTGSPYTFPVGIIPVQGLPPGIAPKVIPAFEQFNNVRTPVRHRLDVGVAYKKQHKKSTSEWNAGIYNVYNQANPYFLYFDVNRQEDGTGKIVARQRSLLPFTPTLRYTCLFDL